MSLVDSENGQLRLFALDPKFNKDAQSSEGQIFPLEGTMAEEAVKSLKTRLVTRVDLEASESPVVKSIAALGIKSGCLAPLISRGRAIGVISMTSLRENAFTAEDAELLTLIASQIAIAVENALNFERARAAEEQAKRHSERVQLLLEINNAVASNLDLKMLMPSIFSSLSKVLPYDVIGLGIYDPEINKLRAYANVNIDGFIEEGEPIPLEGSIPGLVFTTGKPVLLDRLNDARFQSDWSKRFRQAGFKSGGSVPIVVQDRVLGTLGVAGRREIHISEEDVELLCQVANQLAIAVENALNYERARKAEDEVKRKLELERLMLEINNAVVSKLNLDELLTTISESLHRVMPHDFAGMALYDPDIGQLRVQALDYKRNQEIFGATDLVPLKGTGSGKAFTSRKTVLLPRIDPDGSSIEVVRDIVAAGLKSSCHVPLISHDKVLGTLDLMSFRENAFTRDDADLLAQTASQIAIAVENAVNFERARAAEQQTARERERLDLLLDINNKIASSLDLRELFKAISLCLRSVLHHDYADLAFYDPETDRMRLYAVDRSDVIDFGVEDVWVPVEGTPPGLAIHSRKTVLRERPDLTEFPSESFKRAVEEGIRSGCTVPLVSRDRVVGVLTVASSQESAFTQADAELLTEIGVQISIAVDNALNFEAVRSAEAQMARDRDRLRLLLNVNNAIVSQLDLRDLVRSVASHFRDAFKPDFVGLSLYDPEINQLRTYSYDFPANKPFIEVGQAIPLEGSIAGLAFTTGKPIFTNKPLTDQRFSAEAINQRIREVGFKSGGCVPLIAHGRKLGTLGVASFSEAAFDEDQIEVFCQVANQVAIAVENALSYLEIETLKNKLASEKLYLESEIRTEHNFEELIGSSPSFRKILKQIETVAPTDSAVLIRGESGTGKELVARAIHNLSSRRERTLVKINCAAIPTGLLESELFGHERGAFTGAISQRVGRFELANKGTLFLDEVGDIPLELQPKLLRVLQEQEFERLGSTRTQKVDVRLIAATNTNLEQMVADKKYRNDLYYRLNVFPITLPPVRDRRDDIPALVRFFTQRYARRLKKTIEAIPVTAMDALTGYDWPGNVRELEHFIERAVILTQGSELEVSLSELKQTTSLPASLNFPTLESAEREHILRALEETNWVVGGPNGAAARLGMKRTTLQSRMQKLGLARTQS
jgi:formate hydrogenlyase transcriptional activator